MDMRGLEPQVAAQVYTCSYYKIADLPARMIVQPNAKDGVDVHLLVNAYDAPGKSPMMRWAQDGLLRYVDTKKSPALSARSGLRLPGLADKPRGSSGKILSQRDLVKYRAESGDNGAAFKREAPTSLPLGAQELDAIVKGIVGSWKAAPPIRLHAGPQELPDALQAEAKRLHMLKNF